MNSRASADVNGEANVVGNDEQIPNGSRGLLLWLSQLARGSETIDGLEQARLLALMPTRLGPFRLESLLGKGTFGVVFRAFDTEMERHVALKVAWPYVMYDAVASKRFLKEPKAAAAFNHPGIVKVYKFGWVRSVCYIAFELVDAPTLGEWLKSQERVPVRLAAHIMREVAEAIQFIHANGLIHRDIKPNNILLKPRIGSAEFALMPLVTDLGLARRVHAPIASGESGAHAIVGTDYYMSPEQAAGQKVDGRSDVFSLGVVLFELVCGRRPFDAARSEQVRQQIQYDEAPSIRGLRKRVPSELEAIIFKCLAKSPSCRYSSAQGLADDLGNFLSGKPVQASLPTRWERGWKLIKRNPSESSLVAVAMASVILVAGLIGAWIRDKGVAAQQIAAAEAVERQHHYAANIRHAATAQTRGGRGEMHRLLEECRSLAGTHARMGIEWEFLWSQANEEDRTLPAHRGSVHKVRFTPHGDLLFSAGEDGRVIAWDTTNWTTRFEFNDRMHEVNCAEISADGSLLAVASDDGRVVVHRIGDGEIIFDQPVVDGQAFALAWLGDQLKFAVGGTNSVVTIVNPISGEIRRSSVLAASAAAVARDPGHPVEIQALAFLPDDETLAVAVSPGGLCFLDPATLAVVSRFDHYPFSIIRDICHIPVGPGFLAHSSFERVHLWNLRNQVNVLDFAVDGEPISLRYSSATKTLVASLRNGDVQAWNIEDLLAQERPVGRRIHAHNGRATTTDISPDGRWLATAGRDKLIRLWRRPENGYPFDVNLASMPRRIDFSPCGQWMAVVHSSDVRSRQVTLYSATSGDRLWSTQDAIGAGTDFKATENHFVDAVFHPTRPIVLCLDADHVLRTRDCATGRILDTYDLPPTEDYELMGFAPDEESLIMRNGKTGPVLWKQLSNDLSNGEPLPRWTIAAFHTTRGDLWVDSKNGKQTFLRSTPSFPPLVTLPGLNEQVLCATLSPDGRYLAAASADSILYVWDLDNVASFAKLIGHQGRPERIRFSNDGETLLSHSPFDGTVRFWHLPTRTELLKIGGQDVRIVCMGLNPAGNLLVFGAECNGRHGLQIHGLGVGQSPLPLGFSSAMPSGN